MMRYFFYTAGDEVCSVRRLDMGVDPVVLERWGGKAWEWWPSTLDAVSPYSADGDSYREASQQEAEEFIRRSTAIDELGLGFYGRYHRLHEEIKGKVTK